MSAAIRIGSVVVLCLGLTVMFGLHHAHEASGGDKKGSTAAEKKVGEKKVGEKKVGEKKVGEKKKGIDNYQHIYAALQQLREARHALHESINREEKETKIEKDVIRELRKAMDEVNQAIARAEKAVRLDRQDDNANSPKKKKKD